MRNFKELEIWTLGMQIVKTVYIVSEQLPNHEKFGLTSQITRAGVSIPSNIAEGCAKSSEKDFKRFLEISLGSAFELETQLLVIEDLNLVEKEKLQKLLMLIRTEQKKIGSFISSIKKRLNASNLKPNTQQPKT